MKGWTDSFLQASKLTTFTEVVSLLAQFREAVRLNFSPQQLASLHKLRRASCTQVMRGEGRVTKGEVEAVS